MCVLYLLHPGFCRRSDPTNMQAGQYMVIPELGYPQVLRQTSVYCTTFVVRMHTDIMSDMVIHIDYMRIPQSMIYD